MIRACCGSWSKPDPYLFITVYRLINMYSLIRLPKGSNVEGTQVFETLLTADDLEVNENKQEWDKLLDTLIERGENVSATKTSDHDYLVESLNEYVQTYFSGFVARKIGQWTACIEYTESCTKLQGDGPHDEMITMLSRGYLKYPSDKLLQLLTALETAVMQTMGEEQLNKYSFQHIAKHLLAEKVTFVGCKTHTQCLTRKVINYYLLTRMKMVCKMHNNVYNVARLEEKQYRKMSILVKSKDKCN